jgi:hypothetical protein
MKINELLEDTAAQMSPIIDQIIERVKQGVTNVRLLKWIDTNLHSWLVRVEKVGKLTPDMQNDAKDIVDFLNGSPLLRTSIKHLSPWDVQQTMEEEKESERHGPIVNVKSKAFRQWFGRSKVVDGRGNPLVCFRGTARVPSAMKFGTKRCTPSFVASGDIASIYASTPGMFVGHSYEPGATVSPVFLSIQKPVNLRIHEKLTLDDLHMILNADLTNEQDQECLLEVIGYLKRRDDRQTMPFEFDLPNGPLGEMDFEELYDAFEREFQRFAKTGQWRRLDDLLCAEIDTYAIVDSPGFVDWAKQKGFDGAIHLDVFDLGQRLAPELLGKSEVRGLSDNNHVTYRPFYPWQIKSVFNKGTWGKDGDITESR